MKKHIIILILISICIRLIHALFQPHIALTPDSYEYYGYANNIALAPSVKLLIQPYRTPVYPFVILSTMVATGSVGAPVGSEGFERSTQLLMVLQSAAAIAGVMLLYALLRALSLSPRASLVISVVHSVNMMLIPWERTMLTESFAILWMIFYAYMIIQIIQKFTLMRISVLLMLSLTGLYLRPAFIFVPLFTFVLLFFLLRTVRTKFKIACTLLIYFGVIYLHINLNSVNWNFRGFQVIGEFNLLGRILQFELPIETGRQYEFFYKNVSDYRSRGGSPNPYRFIDTYDPTLSVNPARLTELTKFNHTVILSQLPKYIVQSISDIPRAFIEISPFIQARSTFLSLIQQTFRIFQSLLLLSIFAIPIAYRRLQLDPSKRNRVIIVLCTLCTAQVVVSALFGYEDLGRLISPIIPLFMIWLSALFTPKPKLS